MTSIRAVRFEVMRAYLSVVFKCAVLMLRVQSLLFTIGGVNALMCLLLGSHYWLNNTSEDISTSDVSLTQPLDG